jgi:hypothetical protein
MRTYLDGNVFDDPPNQAGATPMAKLEGTCGNMMFDIEANG